MSVIGTAVENLTSYFKKGEMGNTVKSIIGVAVGATMYAVMPSVIEGLKIKQDMSGFKRVGWGALIPVTIGLMTKHPTVALGGLSAMFAHIIYVPGNPVVKSITGRFIVPYEKTIQIPATTEAAKAQGQGDFLPAQDLRDEIPIHLPDGTIRTIQTTPNEISNTPPPISDFLPANKLLSENLRVDQLQDFKRVEDLQDFLRADLLADAVARANIPEGPLKMNDLSFAANVEKGKLR
jgi:hypothetical protein